MCREKIHLCMVCGEDYECRAPNWVCPTINDDEDRNMCDKCLEKMAVEMQAWYDERESE